MVHIDDKKLKEKLYSVASVLFRIGEVCVDVSKCHISEEDAINKIRGYLQSVDLHSRFMVDKLIEDCMVEELAYNGIEEKAVRYLKELDMPLQYDYAFDMPDVCKKCHTNPNNGGSGICNCTLPLYDRKFGIR